MMLNAHSSTCAVPGIRRHAAAPPRISRRGRSSCHVSSVQQQLTAAKAPVDALTVSTASLKEWAVTNAALGAGQQTVLFRKGGIKEPRFKPAHREFFLFPTSFHTEVSCLKPGVAEKFAREMAMEPKEMAALPLEYYAQVTGAWTTMDAAALTALDAFHVWNDAFLEQRLKWRPTQAVTILELRAWRLPSGGAALPRRDDLFGCFSWVDVGGAQGVDAAAALTGAVPALSDAEFAERQAALRRVLATLDVEELML